MSRLDGPDGKCVLSKKFHIFLHPNKLTFRCQINLVFLTAEKVAYWIVNRTRIFNGFCIIAYFISLVHTFVNIPAQSSNRCFVILYIIFIYYIYLYIILDYRSSKINFFVQKLKNAWAFEMT